MAKIVVFFTKKNVIITYYEFFFQFQKIQILFYFNLVRKNFLSKSNLAIKVRNDNHNFYYLKLLRQYNFKSLKYTAMFLRARLNNID